MRRILLWMARSAWLRERIPRLAFARRAVRRFMPGEDLASALGAAKGLAAAGGGIVFTRLGENLSRIEEADAVAAHYHAVLDESAAAGLIPEISVKLTQLGLDIDREVCLRHCLALAEHAERIGSSLWIDMEDSSYVDRTLQIYETVLAAHPRTGICLQAYLRRSAADVVRLLPKAPSIRLVKGAYQEPAAVAFRARSEVDASFQSLSLLIADGARERLRARVAEIYAEDMERLAAGLLHRTWMLIRYLNESGVITALPTITSGYRPGRFNVAAGGAPRSAHLT